MVSKEELGDPPLAQETLGSVDFLDAIGRPDLKEILTSRTPWLSLSLGVYLEELGMYGGGGLEILMGDMIYQAKKLGIPFVHITNFYPERVKQIIDKDFYPQETDPEVLIPEQFGFEGKGQVSIQTVNRMSGLEQTTRISVYQSRGFPVVALYEPGMKYLYVGKNDDDHRLYQQSALGFGENEATKQMRLVPAMRHLNEPPVTLAPLAELDGLCSTGQNFEQARKELSASTLLTNHTLVPAALPTFSLDQFEHFVIPNTKSEDVKNWLRELIQKHGGNLNVSILSTELSGLANGVSNLHAEIASSQFQRDDGSYVEFFSVTNGISFERWLSESLYRYYQQTGLIDQFDLPTKDYQQKIASLSIEQLETIKDQAKKDLRLYLDTRQDQYGQPISLPEEAKIACWTKRYVGYKRPEMIFEDVEQLKSILLEQNVHIILSGRAHPEDRSMKETIQRILKRIDADPILKERIHFVQNYDEGLAKQLVAGVDIWFNTPEIGKEACGTSWMKSLINLGILISTEDGGVADIKPAHYLKVDGKNYQEEVKSLYEQFRKATIMLDNEAKDAWGEFVKDQLSAYLPVLSISRMLRDYLNFALSQKGEADEQVKVLVAIP